MIFTVIGALAVGAILVYGLKQLTENVSLKRKKK